MSRTAHPLSPFLPFREVAVRKDPGVKKCHTCHGRGFTPGLRDLSTWSCPDCLGTGEECGHAQPVHRNALTSAVTATAEAL